MSVVVEIINYMYNVHVYCDKFNTLYRTELIMYVAKVNLYLVKFKFVKSEFILYTAEVIL